MSNRRPEALDLLRDVHKRLDVCSGLLNESLEDLYLKVAENGFEPTSEMMEIPVAMQTWAENIRLAVEILE